MDILFYYLETDEKYHGEVYELLQIIQQDQIDEEVEAQQKKAQKRLDELVRLSK